MRRAGGKPPALFVYARSRFSEIVRVTRARSSSRCAAIIIAYRDRVRGRGGVASLHRFPGKIRGVGYRGSHSGSKTTLNVPFPPESRIGGRKDGFQPVARLLRRAGPLPRFRIRRCVSARSILRHACIDSTMRWHAIECRCAIIIARSEHHRSTRKISRA